MEHLPDKMTGHDLVVQENYEMEIEKNYFNTLDRVDRRDKQGEIVSFVPNAKYRQGYDHIDWSIHNEK